MTQELISAESRVTIHMVSSLDGYIAKNDNSISWFETAHHYEKGVDAENPEKFLDSIDCYVMGSKTYELALELSKDYGWPYGNKKTFVLTHRNLSSDKPNIEFIRGDLATLVNEKLKPAFRNIWVVGGACLVKTFIREHLADEIRISILPIILGDGLPFFDQIGLEQPLRLEDVKTYKNGMVELHYMLSK